MDTTDLQDGAISKPSNLTRKRKAKEDEKEEDSIKVLPKKRRLYFNGPYRQQNWSLPDSIIYYITQKPSSSKGYKKMIQCCKYFFAKNPITVLSDIFYRDFWEARSGNEKIVRFDLRGKLWITDKLTVSPRLRYQRLRIADTFVPKTYQSDVKYLFFKDQIISINDILFLASKAEKIIFTRVLAKDQDGNVVRIEKLVEVLPKVKEMNIDINTLAITKINNKEELCRDVRKTLSLESMKELLKLEHFSKLDRFKLEGITEVFDIETFYVYMKTNKHTYFILMFDDSISEAYKNRLESIIDELIQTENHSYKIPFIKFPGLSDEKLQNMHVLVGQD